MAININEPGHGIEMRGLQEVLDQLRAVRRQYRKGYGPLRTTLRAQNDTLCWVLGATDEERRHGSFLGGILNVDF